MSTKTIRREVVIHREEIIDMLKKAVADKAGEFFGLDDWKLRYNPDNFICVNDYDLILPKEGLHFTCVDNPVELPKK